MTQERKEEILRAIISFIDNVPVGYEVIKINWEKEWDEFKSEIEIK